MSDLRAARVVYLVHAPAPGGVTPPEIEQIVARHPLATGHVELTSFVGNEALQFARTSLPAARDFLPEIDFESYAKLRQAKAIWRIEATEIEPEDLGYLRAALLIAGEIAAMTHGTVVDALAYTNLGATDIAREVDRAFDPLRHVTIHVDRGARPFFIHTHGMEKFGHPDFELHGVPRPSVEIARRLLRSLIAAVVAGGHFSEGEQTQLCGFSFSFGASECDAQNHFSERSLSLRSFQLLGDATSPEMAGMLTR